MVRLKAVVRESLGCVVREVREVLEGMVHGLHILSLSSQWITFNLLGGFVS